MKQHKIKAFSAALLLLAGMTGCSTPAGLFAGGAQTVELTNSIRQETVEGLEPDAAFLSTQNAFSFTLMQKAAKECAGNNILLSPYSLMQVLALTANGAAGDTRAEFEQLFGGIPAETLNEYLYTYRTSMPNTENARFLTANSVWLRTENGTLTARDDFLHIAKNHYGAEIYSSPFDDKAVSIINKWGSDHTNQMIPKLIDAFSGDTGVMLINAIVFDAKWAQPYLNEPQTSRFRTALGQEKECQMMRSTELYLEDENAEGFWKPYADGYAFAAILPKNDISPEEYLAHQNADTLRDLLSDIEQPEYTAAGLPEFKLDYSFDLVRTLTEMNLQSAFSSSADFSGIADAPLYIGKIMQKTAIEVSTEGTKAAAATIEELDSSVDPYTEHQVILDRPFLYMIVDTDTMLPIFTGILNDPAV